ncbi:DUF2922 domain-containing protein [Peptostreptococcus equinus]|uniref:DUF2922 domain-containing protein n=1 Tax=Peptostreptococcus equinus TaxID=3003601 RepID=A0ABY7JQR2_9FIRM|nr:DUF2922 domain-containing protein [Peptostreptococcus sp. CBA3647]WAW14388.1 DUF2922 domain-containing protein [Peptostreptococcus sp. CBA3647]
MDKAKNLVMRFKKEDGKIYTLSVKNPKDELTEEEIKQAMNFIVEKNLILPKGIKLISASNAKIVTTESEILDLVI